MSNLNNIIDQIQELIKNQKIEWKEIKDICEIRRGERITKKQLIDNGKYKVISGGKDIFGKYNRYNRDENTISICQYGTAGYIDFQKEKYWANDVSYSIHPKDLKYISNKFLYYSLINKQKEIYSLTTKAIPDCLPKEKLQEIQIPIPPLDIQNKIVEILDNFSNYETELETELETRTKQYNYYLNKLLDFSNSSDVEWKEIKDICEIRRGKSITKNYISNHKGNFPVYSSQTTNNGTIGYIDTFDLDGEYISWTTDGVYAGTVFYRNEKFNITSHCGVLKIINNLIVPKYLFYYLKINLYKYVNNNASQPMMLKEKLQEIQIPIPPLEIQNKIVEILDNFSSLVNDIKDGLPKEIQLRKKQYNYYLNKLLDFKENK